MKYEEAFECLKKAFTLAQIDKILNSFLVDNESQTLNWLYDCELPNGPPLKEVIDRIKFGDRYDYDFNQVVFDLLDYNYCPDYYKKIDSKHADVLVNWLRKRLSEKEDISSLDIFDRSTYQAKRKLAQAVLNKYDHLNIPF